jgi:hypothetical protein
MFRGTKSRARDHNHMDCCAHGFCDMQDANSRVRIAELYLWAPGAGLDVTGTLELVEILEFGALPFLMELMGLACCSPLNGRIVARLAPAGPAASPTFNEQGSTSNSTGSTEDPGKRSDHITMALRSDRNRLKTPEHASPLISRILPQRRCPVV